VDILRLCSLVKSTITIVLVVVKRLKPPQNNLTSNFLILDFMQRLLKVTNRLKQLQRFESRSIIPIVILRQFFRQTLDIDQNKEIDDDHYHVKRTTLRL
jgi:hypothetical protein